MARSEYMERAFSSELRPRAWLVLQVLVLRCDKEGECFPSVKTIVAKCGYGTSTVKRALDELVEADCIIKQARFGERKNDSQTSDLYTLCSDTPRPPVPEQPAESTLSASGEEAEETENVHSSVPGSILGGQSALFLFPVYSFVDGFKERPDGKNTARMLHRLGDSPFLYPLEPCR